MNTKKSVTYYKQAVKLMPGGVNSPVRAFGAVGGNPIFIDRAKGSKVYDVDGNSYIDYVLSWGPLILGHAQKQVISIIKKSLSRGTSFGAPTKAEVELSKMINQAFPSMQMMRLVNSGTEATMSAIRLARGYTKKDKIVKFSGCYHGHNDSLLVKAGSGAATFGVPSSHGIPRDLTRGTIVLPYNNIDKLKSVIKSRYKEIAAVIVEPICGNMGVVLPDKGFLSEMRKITRKYGVLLIFDEIITGFRFCFGGAQKLFKVKPDITCLGKIIGGGMPIGAYGASKKIMQHISPLGGVYQAGTLSGNPIAVACGLKTLQILREMDYNKLNKLCAYLCREITQACNHHSMNMRINRIGSMFTLFFSQEQVVDFRTAYKADTGKYAQYFRQMLKAGIYLPPSQFEANFLSFAHTEKDIAFTIAAVKKVLEKLRR
ncbi:MAG: glutamate-1-semialdehyde 2,1-aminomutase [PVC group bacterium]|nr:glutamate-1-semialdehyde 2,1-aminomutase [PVC group bacterium]